VTEIALTRGLVAQVDCADLELLSGYRWHAGTCGRAAYGRTRSHQPDRKMLYMHRLIMGAQAGQIVDHINGDTLDNRRENLRLCTPRQNLMNTLRVKPNITGFRGVHYHAPRGRRKGYFAAVLKVEGRKYYSGYFGTAEAAARHRDALALKHHGEFAVLNFPDDVHPLEARRPYCKNTDQCAAKGLGHCSPCHAASIHLARMAA
jgi:hypothetical protein